MTSSPNAPAPPGGPAGRGRLPIVGIGAASASPVQALLARLTRRDVVVVVVPEDGAPVELSGLRSETFAVTPVEDGARLEGPWADARLRASLDRVVLEGRSFRDLRVPITGPHGAARSLRLSGSRVHLPAPEVGVGTPVLLIAWTETHADPEEAR